MPAASDRERSGAPDRSKITMTKLYLLNTTIITTPGLTYTSETISVEQATRRLEHHRGEVISAIGHEATAQLASRLFGRPILQSRIAAAMLPGDHAICIKLKGRAPEGAILTLGELDAIGYEIVLLEAQDPAVRRESFRLIERAAYLLGAPDDTAPAEAEQTPGTRRRGNFPMQVHYVVRRPQAHGGTYVDVALDWGTEAWSVDDISAEEARSRYTERSPAAA
mgnify:CR=1 FL=1